MKKIAFHNDIEIFAPDNSRFSFLKSPYAAHRTFSAVDIYYGDFGDKALSPVDGRVIDIQRFNSPTPFKDRDFAEYVIAIRKNRHVIKILHVKPDVQVGEYVSKGDSIGTFIRNGYFIFWNDPPMHVEVRRLDDYLRASNDLRLTPDIRWNRLPFRQTIELDCIVEEVNERYALLSAPYETCDNIRGFALDGGFLDGFVSTDPGEGFFGIVKREGYFHPEISSLEITKGSSVIKCAGIASCLFFDEPRIKVIPFRYGKRLFSPGDTAGISIRIQ